jgi:hypothetical protein
MRSILAILVLALASPAAAQDQPVELSITPWSSYDGVDRPYRFIASVRARGAATEVLGDHRLVEIEVRPNEGRGRHVCRHPNAPRRMPEGRVRTLDGGAAWTEWIDLRMYCWGRARAALDAGAQLTFRYGYAGRSRTRWIARRGDLRVHRLELPAIAVGPATAPADTRSLDRNGPEVTRVIVEMAPISARSGRGMVFRPSVRAREGNARLYLRPDAWSFRVIGPLGEVYCAIEEGGGSPPPDLFRRVSARARASSLLEAGYFCPEGTFDLEGVYEVEPQLRLDHSGEEYGLGAVTGRFAGRPVTLRISAGSRGYVEQVPQRDDAGADE